MSGVGSRQREESRGRPISAMDALIASTALAHGLTLVTRNARDFEGAVKSIPSPGANLGAFNRFRRRSITRSALCWRWDSVL